MGPILHVVTDPAPTAALREALTRLGCDVQVAALHEGRGFDPRPWLDVRRRVRDVRPAIIHAWGSRALTPATIFRPRGCKIVTCEWDPRGWFDRRKARRAEVIATIPPAVAEPLAIDRTNALGELSIPQDARIIACSGRIDPGHGFMEAAWVFDILKYVYPNLWLLVLGDGPQRRRVEEFARSLGRDDYRLRFAGIRPDAPSMLGLAEVVWAFGECGGMRPALEAVAAGRPVVARQHPGWAELLGDAALLVPNADRHEAARATRRILDDASLRTRMESAAQMRATAFAPEHIAPQWVELYARLTQT